MDVGGVTHVKRISSIDKLLKTLYPRQSNQPPGTIEEHSQKNGAETDADRRDSVMSTTEAIADAPWTPLGTVQPTVVPPSPDPTVSELPADPPAPRQDRGDSTHSLSYPSYSPSPRSHVSGKSDRSHTTPRSHKSSILSWRWGSHKVTAPKLISVYVASWNVGNRPANLSECKEWLPDPTLQEYDIVVIGLQECSYKLSSSANQKFLAERKNFKEGLRVRESQEEERRQSYVGSACSASPSPPALSAVRSQSQIDTSRGWLGRNRLTKGLAERRHRRKMLTHHPLASLIQIHMGVEYRAVEKIALMDMRMVVLAHSRIHNAITKVHSHSKATGLGGVLGNKGGLIVRLEVHNTSLCFVSCHLTAHEGEAQVKSRNSDVFEILKAASNSTPNRLDVWLNNDHTFVFGDLNYRVDLAISTGRRNEELIEDLDEEVEAEAHRNAVLELIRKGNLPALYRADQLRREMEASNVLVGFKEKPPTFPPTFKVIPGQVLEYNTQRVPSYCDRILHCSRPGLEAQLLQDRTGAAIPVVTSDHKPVFSTFEIANKQPVNQRRPSLLQSARTVSRNTFGTTNRLRLRFKAISVAGLMPSSRLATTRILRFYGSILVKEKERSHPVEGGAKMSSTWGPETAPSPQLKSFDVKDLRHRYVVLTLWEIEKGKRRWTLEGQAVLWLDRASYKSWGHFWDFQLPLVRHGIPNGTISGSVAVTSPAAGHGEVLKWALSNGMLGDKR